LTGIPSKKLINIYDKFAHGGFGLIITGNASVDPNYLESAGNLLICRENETDERQQQFRILSKTVKQEGSLAILQLVHPGNLTPVLINPNPCTFSEESIKEQVIDRFVYAAQQV
jgi:2,4-dienoyl-CoA reductase-like NADH-dependent reductase (Old Yellow Enzyme family)